MGEGVDVLGTAPVLFLWQCTCMYVCMHTYIHVRMHAYIHTYVRTRHALPLSCRGITSGHCPIYENFKDAQQLARSLPVRIAVCTSELSHPLLSTHPRSPLSSREVTPACVYSKHSTARHHTTPHTKRTPADSAETLGHPRCLIQQQYLASTAVDEITYCYCCS